MDLSPVLRQLQRSARLALTSTPNLAYEVQAKAKEKWAASAALAYLKTPQPVDLPPYVDTSPAEILRELGVATTFLTHSPFTQIAQLWAHVRYCAALRTGRGGLLELTPQAATDVVHHHKVAQSEQLGIGIALVAARAVLARRYPGCLFRAVDADVALKAGHLEELPDDEVAQAPETRKRPDYFLVGRQRQGGRSRVRIVVLECKGTHLEPADVIKQLGDACLQVRTVAIGRRRMYGLMVASRLTSNGITAHVLDPPGDDDWWEGSDDEFDALLSGPPAPQPEMLREPPARYEIPPGHAARLIQILIRSTAASVLAYVGDNSTAAHYTTSRQRGYDPNMIPDLELPWPDSIGARIRLPHGPVLRGTSYRMPLAGRQSLTVFRGIEEHLYHDLADGNMLSYLRRAGGLHRWWHKRRRASPGNLFTVGEDGTALMIRLIDGRAD